MFLESLIRRNRAFVEAAVLLHQANSIPANSYVLDLDSIEVNARQLTAEAHRRSLAVYAMSKQVGRAPGALEVITRGGADGYVAVDMGCARPIAAHGHSIGNLGHLVQIPRAEAPEAAALLPHYWTIFSRNKAEEASRSVAAQGGKQKVLLRIWDHHDIFYPGHEGGFHIDELGEAIDYVNRLPGLRFAGLTTFPALLYDTATKKVAPTVNVATLERGAKAVRSYLGDQFPLEINAPGTTSSAVLDMLAERGATQVEPGHGLTGTTPLHAVEELPEKPAVLYLTEVAHLHQDVPLCFGGGFYVDPVFEPYPVKVVVAADPGEVSRPTVSIDMPDPAGIDYYARLHPEGRTIREGDTVIAGFRIQAFVTRSLVVGLSGVGAGTPAVEGIWNVEGAPVSWAGG